MTMHAQQHPKFWCFPWVPLGTLSIVRFRNKCVVFHDFTELFFFLIWSVLAKVTRGPVMFSWSSLKFSGCNSWSVRDKNYFPKGIAKLINHKAFLVTFEFASFITNKKLYSKHYIIMCNIYVYNLQIVNLTCNPGISYWFRQKLWLTYYLEVTRQKRKKKKTCMCPTFYYNFF